MVIEYDEYNVMMIRIFEDIFHKKKIKKSDWVINVSGYGLNYSNLDGGLWLEAFYVKQTANGQYARGELSLVNICSIYSNCG